MNTQFKKGVLEMCVLGLIDQDDRYGYEIVEMISQHVEVTEGTIYPLLRRLVGESYVTTYLLESSTGPSRKYYRLTEAGRRRYSTQLKEWNEFVENVNVLIRNSSEASVRHRGDEQASMLEREVKE